MGSQVSLTKNWIKKNKFRELFTEEMQEITDNAIPVTTLKSHKIRNENIQRYVPVKFPLKGVKFQT